MYAEVTNSLKQSKVDKEFNDPLQIILQKSQGIFYCSQADNSNIMSVCRDETRDDEDLALTEAQLYAY